LDHTEDALVVVRTYTNNFDAEIAKSALEAAGVDTMLKADDCGGMRPHLWMGGIQLLVRSGDVERAIEILDSSARREA
jgi:Putative prokaryotic signal transducing protein